MMSETTLLESAPCSRDCKCPRGPPLPDAAAPSVAGSWVPPHAASAKAAKTAIFLICLIAHPSGEFTGPVMQWAGRTGLILAPIRLPATAYRSKEQMANDSSEKGNFERVGESVGSV